MKKIFVINGPNLNLLGVREPDIYGRETYESLTERIRAHCLERGVATVFVQSNHEGDLIDAIHRAFFEGATGVVINPGAYTHTSIALLDAVKSTSLPTVEVHISDVDNREEFRKTSYIRAACIATVSGHGTAGYLEAVDLLLAHETEGEA